MTGLFQSVYSHDGTPPQQHSPITWHYRKSFPHRAFFLRRRLGIDLSQRSHDVNLFATIRIIKPTRKNLSFLVRCSDINGDNGLPRRFEGLHYLQAASCQV